MKNFRKPYVAIFFSFVMLIVSCEQYDNDEIAFEEQSFDYSLLKNFISTS